ncbi:MmcQ/YjbR family DNA-binding protein [Actinokineospora inagensis]|uniref:MmcQ/YjbR family DNA-binding protein n=1 Tax=Actinokineospora inagensis TaxID=103730 RepID=UPI000414A7C9|nr:MmcQ/YjbR family DNA-binding protein [Actinokineospora inagensis]
MDIQIGLRELREICLAMPAATERISHGSPSWFVRDKKMFTTYAHNHHDSNRIGFWCPAPPGVQAELVAEDPERFYRPPYVGHRGWLGVYLDVDVDWAEIAEIVDEGYRVIAPKQLVAELDARST